MALKLLTLLLLLGLTFAAPRFEDETEDPLNEDEMLDEVIDDADNDDDKDDENEADGMEETPGAKAKYTALFGHNIYCTCKKGAFSSAAKGDEFDMDEAADEIAQNAIAKVKADKRSIRTKKFKAYLVKLIKPFFKTSSLGCHCTTQKSVVRLLAYLHRQALLSHKQKIDFTLTVRRFIGIISKQRIRGKKRDYDV